MTFILHSLNYNINARDEKIIVQSYWSIPCCSASIFGSIRVCDFGIVAGSGACLWVDHCGHLLFDRLGIFESCWSCSFPLKCWSLLWSSSFAVTIGCQGFGIVGCYLGSGSLCLNWRVASYFAAVVDCHLLPGQQRLW